MHPPEEDPMELLAGLEFSDRIETARKWGFYFLSDDEPYEEAATGDGQMS